MQHTKSDGMVSQAKFAAASPHAVAAALAVPLLGLAHGQCCAVVGSITLLTSWMAVTGKLQARGVVGQRSEGFQQWACSTGARAWFAWKRWECGSRSLSVPCIPSSAAALTRQSWHAHEWPPRPQLGTLQCAGREGMRRCSHSWLFSGGFS